MIVDKQTRARELRKVIEAAAQTADEKTISEAPELCRSLKQDGGLVSAGTRINWNGTVKKAAVSLWDTEANDPDHAPTLWADIAYRDGYRIIPETITVTTAFSKGEKAGGQTENSTSPRSITTFTRPRSTHATGR